METGSKDSLKPTPVNWRVVLVSFTTLIASATTVTMVFPFLPWMVRKFKVNGEFIQEEDTGYYVGLVVSMYFFGRFLACYFWGILADKKGRRLTIILSGSGVSIFTIAFGFTNTQTGLVWAIAFRMLAGASNGIIGSCKAAIADVSDNSNQAKGMTFTSAAWTLGLIAGPAIGGLLAEPVRQYPGVFPKGFLETFPYFLPCAVSSGLNFIGIAIVFFWLPETLKKRNKRDDEDEDDDEEGVVLYRPQEEEDGDGLVSIRKTEEVELQQENSINDFESESMLAFSELKKRKRRSSVSDLMKKTTAWAILKAKEARLALATYCVFSFSVIGSGELSSLWMATKQFRGGIGFSEKEIGLFQAITGLALAPFQLLFAHRMERKLGSRTTFYVCCTVCVLSVACLPITSSIESEVAIWAALFIINLPMGFSIGVAFVMISLFINNSVAKHQVGAVNGLAVSLTALTRKDFCSVFWRVYFCLVH
ncbi:uncharacterized protein [Oscarella lobularis]|uniref:uncharacterized protein n=1 Tax=Oscarella lobularis TaxID=121494 RepID=UPI003313B07A